MRKRIKSFTDFDSVLKDILNTVEKLWLLTPVSSTGQALTLSSERRGDLSEVLSSISSPFSKQRILHSISLPKEELPYSISSPFSRGTHILHFLSLFKGEDEGEG